MRIPFSHTPNYDPASPHSKLQQNLPPHTHDDTTHHTKRTNTMLFLVPYLCLSRQPPDVIQRYARLPWSEINGASNDTQRSEQNTVFPFEFGSTSSATWWWPSDITIATSNKAKAIAVDRSPKRHGHVVLWNNNKYDTHRIWWFRLSSNSSVYKTIKAGDMLEEWTAAPFYQEIWFYFYQSSHEHLPPHKHWSWTFFWQPVSSNRTWWVRR